MTETLDVDNPYHHTKLAQQAELDGNFRQAESQFKAAVKAADNLPLADYKRHFLSNQAQEHVVKHAAENFESTHGISSLQEVENAYHELIALPFLTRIQLAGFYARHEAIPEAKDVCDDAFRIGLDPIVIENKSVSAMHRRGIELQRHLGDILGPDNVEDIFNATFDRLDVNRDGFVDDQELKRAQLDITIGAEAQQVIRYLLHNYYEVEKASNDEFGLEISGITKADVRNYERKSGERWKRMKKKPR